MSAITRNGDFLAELNKRLGPKSVSQKEPTAPTEENTPKAMTHVARARIAVKRTPPKMTFVSKTADTATPETGTKTAPPAKTEPAIVTIENKETPKIEPILAAATETRKVTVEHKKCNNTLVWVALLLAGAGAFWAKYML